MSAITSFSSSISLTLEIACPPEIIEASLATVCVKVCVCMYAKCSLVTGDIGYLHIGGLTNIQHLQQHSNYTMTIESKLCLC